eukprot:scaffold5015_cov92-Isochrysis_galbana.AAC.3
MLKYFAPGRKSRAIWSELDIFSVSCIVLTCGKWGSGMSCTAEAGLGHHRLPQTRKARAPPSERRPSRRRSAPPVALRAPA